MNKVKYRIHFKSGLHIDVEEETDKENYTEIWKELLDIMENKPKETIIWNLGAINKKFYMYSVKDIVCFEKL